jgi:hypothetical protein
MILEMLRWSFGFEIESITDSNESRRFLLALLNLKQYISIKLMHGGMNATNIYIEPKLILII